MAANFWTSSHWEQWIFEKTDLIRSRRDDLQIYSEDEYSKFMIFWANFIHSLATEGNVASSGCGKTREQVIATATVYFKRFYIRRSFKDMDPFLVSCTSLFLASKVEEYGTLSIKTLLRNITHILQKRWPSVTFDQNQTANIAALADSEFIIVEILDCCLIVYHPHRPLVTYLADLQKNVTPKDFEQMESQCWRVCNDSLRSDVCLLFAPHVIAISSIIIGAELMNREKDIKEWLCELSVDMEKVLDCTNIMFNMYKLWKAFDEKEQVRPLFEKLPKINPIPPGY